MPNHVVSHASKFCPGCGKELGRTVITNGAKAPNALSLTVCIVCHRALLFGTGIFMDPVDETILLPVVRRELAVLRSALLSWRKNEARETQTSMFPRGFIAE